jgi:hypothetical protein
MRSTALLLAGLLGCAHTTETHESSTTIVSAPESKEIIAVDEPPSREEAPRARPRLAQTITLGQSNGESTYSAAPPAPDQAQGGNVIVNNNVIINGGYGGYGGYYGGYSYGYGRGVGIRADGTGGHRGGGSGRVPWGSTGWEGAGGRPAAPGRTPGVGGNWSSPPSYGPSQMK